MDLWQAPGTDVRPLLTRERRDLLEWLDAAGPQGWLAPTAAPGWTVKDVALHLLDDDLGWLSRHRDGDRTGLLDAGEHRAFVAALAAKNEAWVRGAQQLSARVVRDLLEWVGGQADRHYAALDLTGEGHVHWAGTGPVPQWLDVAQDLTERWVHGMQMREAAGQVGDYADAYLGVVLRTFVWAFPHQYRPVAPAGTRVALDLGAGGAWTLSSDGAGRWELDPGAADDPAALLAASDDAGWRWLTGAAVPPGGLRSEGPEHLVRPLLDVRGIIV